MTFWKKRTLRLRLALWYAGIAALVFAVAAWFVHETVEHRLRAELDRQLRIDFDLIEPDLDQAVRSDGQNSWRLRGAHGDDGYGRLAAWFEVWSTSGELLARHWPVPEEQLDFTLPAPGSGETLRFHTLEIEPGFHARLMERPARLGDQRVVARMFRDESTMRHTLREVAAVQLAALPLALLLSALGGYFLAGRSLSPVGEMAEHARRITAVSLDERLPVANPHDELGRLAAVVNDAIARLDRSFTELQRFTADASHELRTPLTALRAVGETALRGEGEDAAALRDAVGSMLEEAERLTSLTDALLALARAESAGAGNGRERIDLSALLDETVATLEILAEEKKQVLARDFPPGMTAVTDPELLRQAVFSLLHNAIRHSPEGGRITLRIRHLDGETAIEVEDTGPGIAPEHQEKIFERFYRIDRARSRSRGGTGLGLSIAKLLVERQGGRLELESEPDRGSLFRILLPDGSNPT